MFIPKLSNSLKLIVNIINSDIMFHNVFQVKTTFQRQPLEDNFPNFGFEDKERTHIFHRRVETIWTGGVAVLQG